ncbi:MAG TPA: hypothetical protein VME68_04200 [Acidobacteriaceae bacterium]|nr:hypothetical protein [Acidobacteriaceae bacterium]
MRSGIRFGALALSTMAFVAATGCGGGKKTPPPPATYTIGGTISGLTGSGLVLQNNGGDNLTVSASSSTFTFATAITGTYDVTVLTQPSGENCTITSGTGTASANVTGVSIACVAAYTIGGQVLGVSAAGLVLQDNGGNNVTVGASDTSYAFVFDGAIPMGGAAYAITVMSNPSGQACTVSNPIGTATADVTNANVTCTNLASTTYTVGGTVAGLTGGGLILQDDLGLNDTDLLPVGGNGNFTFVDPVASGGSYNVSVFAQPATRNCTVNDGMGTAAANVTNVSVICVGDWTWMGGSSVVGNSGNGATGIYGTLGTAAAGNIPGGREQELTWTDASGNLWLFGGYGMDSTGTGFGGQLNDLWKYANGEWTWMGGSNVTPPSTSFGAAGASGVYGTLGTPSSTTDPGGREQVASWKDASGNIWLFGGEGIDVNGVTGELNDLWEFNPSLGSHGEWTWMGGSDSVGVPFGGPSGTYGTMGTADPANNPGGRYGAISWVDAAGNFWLYGGSGVDSAGTYGYLNDLWMFNPKLGTHGEWTWMAGDNVVGNGGNGASGVYGMLNTPDPANMPGARDAGMSWVDASGNVWLFGGYGVDANGAQGFLNDLWKYTPGSNEAAGVWTWMGGSSTASSYGSVQSAVYGSLGVASSANIPGGRFSGVTWVDASGNFYLYGGDGYDSAGVNGYLNDLWKFDPTANAWTWEGGSTTVGRTGGQTGIYGTLGMPNAANVPGGRFGIGGWIDSTGNLWLFGGDGYDSKGNQGNLNDLWQYQP